MRDQASNEKEPGLILRLMYADEDTPVAEIIGTALRGLDIKAQNGSLFLYPNTHFDYADHDVEAGEYIVTLVSRNSVDSKWLSDVFSQEQRNYLLMKGITLLPVVIDDSIPPSFLKPYQLFDLTSNEEAALHALTTKISQVPKINFTLLDYMAFENLVEDLLIRLGFTNINGPARPPGQHSPFDFVATYERLDPFGAPRAETWVIETKLYKVERVDLRTLHQITKYLHIQSAPNYSALITNGQLTSAAREWLQSSERERPIPLTIVEGTDLKRLLLNYRDLIDKYFSEPEMTDERSQ